MSEHADTRRMWRLLDVARSLFAEPDAEAVFQRILEAARELTGARYAALGVLDPQRVELESFRTAGIDDETRSAIAELPRGRGVLGLLVSDPKPVRIADVTQHRASYGFPPGHPIMHSFLGVPVHVRGEVCGNLYLADKDGEFDESDEEVALIAADWAAAAIESGRAGPAAGRRWQDAAPAPSVERDSPGDLTATAATVLLVEDEPVLRALVVRMLEEQGYLVLNTGDGLEAMALAERHRGPLDLLIADVVMPGLSGPELAGRLRELRPELEALFMSGYSDSRLLRRGVKDGSVNLLAKPFTPNELLERVRALTSPAGS